VLAADEETATTSRLVIPIEILLSRALITEGATFETAAVFNYGFMTVWELGITPDTPNISN